MSDSNNKREFSFSDKDFKFLVVQVKQRTGIVLAENKRDMVYGRVVRRLRALNLRNVQDYCDLLVSDDGAEEISEFVNAVTTNLTKFFRESHHFDHLRDSVLKPLVNRPPADKKVRIWSAGCSSGMEPYSIAMTAHHIIPSIHQWDFKILATDVDTNMLNTGKSGIYYKKDIETVPSLYQKTFIIPSDVEEDKIEIKDNIKQLIAFKQLNFLDNWPMRGLFDVIFCRNVMIYFDREFQAILLDKFANLLKPEGWMYIGHSENMANLTTRFELKGRTIYKKIA